MASARLDGMKFDAVVASTMRRAVETARLLVQSPIEPRLCNLCVERCFGVLEGLTWKQVQALDPPVRFVEAGGDLHSVDPPSGERFEEVWERASRFRDLLLRDYATKRVLMVSHGVFLQMFHGVLRGSTWTDSLCAYPANLALTTFCLSDGRLTSENTIRLLNEAGADF
jgi:broad specificity phosphatase PhoE